MHDTIDLRSDTVTKPTPAMLRAMAEAPVGDDVLGDDPTVQALEEKGARLLGKEAALFVPSGTMGNNVAIKVHTQPGDEILLDWDAHSMCYEVGAPAVLSAVQTRAFRSNLGVPCVEEIASAIRKPDLHAPGTALLVLENTHNRAGGAIIPLDIHRALFNLTRERGIKLHLDGARLFNTASASGIAASEYAAQADSVSFCLSKGLGCPVGSLLCGTREFVGKARRVRKMFGGGMRQVGVLAAAGIVALDTMIDRLADDHRNALRLAQGMADLPGITVDLNRVQTNMVYFDTLGPSQELADRLETQKVRCLAVGAKTIRMVTHHDVDEEDINGALEVLKKATQ